MCNRVRQDGQIVEWGIQRIAATPWWLASTADQRADLLTAARDFLTCSDPCGDTWFGTGERFPLAFAGRLTLMLLQEHDASSLDALSPEVMTRWIAALLDPCLIVEEGTRDNADALLTRAFRSSPEEYIRLTLRLATAEIEAGQGPSSLRAVEPVVDAQWLRGLCAFMDLPAIRGHAVRHVLDTIATIDTHKATTLAMDLVNRWWCGATAERGEWVDAAGFLLKRAPDRFWSGLRDRFVQSPLDGLRATRIGSRSMQRDLHCPPFEDPDVLASFYRWCHFASRAPEVTAARREADGGLPTPEWILSAARNRLATMEVPEGIDALKKLREEFPEDEVLAYTLANAREHQNAGQWRGWPIHELLAALVDR
jgi:hypothetical protein